MITAKQANREPEIDPLLEHALDDQKSSWGRGERILVEVYLERHAEIRNDTEAILDLIYQEYFLRRERGETLVPDEFYSRFPDLAEPLMLQFGVDAAIPLTAGPRDDDDSSERNSDGSFEKIEGYETIRVLGRGGMGVVYEARDVKLGRTVALKTIVEGQYATPEQRDRFRAEAHAVARLHHPNIISIHAIGEDGTRPYLSLEFAEGGSLAHRLAERLMAANDAATLIETLARAVQAAHTADVVHRDLKPSNVLLTADGVFKISDFGLAKLLDDDSARTLSGQVIGTPSYMAPEQAEGHTKQVGRPADIYALGAILYQALTGRPPFLGASQLETLRLVTGSEVVSPHLLRPDVPRDLETICLKCLEESPGRRYVTALELAEDLGRFRRGEPVRARRIGPLQRSSKWAMRHPWQTTSAATLITAVSAFVGVMYWHTIQLSAKEAKARGNYLEARSAITAMLSRFDDRRLAATPRLLETRGAVREHALAFYERVLNEVDSSDPVVRADTAKALNEACILQSALGRRDQALEGVRRALLLADGLRSERPNELEYMKLRLECLIKLGALLDASNYPDDALAACRESVELAERLAEAQPADSALREQLAMCHTNFGNKLMSVKNVSESMAHYQEATKIRKSIDPSKLPGVTLRLAESLMNEGVLLWGLNPSQAEDRFREAERLMLTTPPDHRDDGGNSVLTLGRIYVNWGGVLNAMERYGDAVGRSNTGLELVEPYLRTEPNDSEARGAALCLHGNRANAFSASRKHRESADDWSKVIELAPQPTPDAYRVRLAMELLQAGELARALAEAKFVKATPDIAGSDRYDLACLYALCAASVQKGAKGSRAQGTGLVESHMKDAMHWLSLAREAGLFDDTAICDHAKKDPDLAILADRADFRRIIEPPQTKQ